MALGYIFDLDGVITDTAEYHYLSWKQLAEQYGLPFTREDNEALRGVSRRQSLELLLKGAVYPEDEMQRMMTLKNEYYQVSLQQITPKNLLPGVGDFLKEAKSRDIRIGIGSASRNARAVCDRLGLVDMLDVIGDGYSVVNPKPAPDLFVWVAGGMRLNPRDCIVFEDATAGVQSALEGGFWTVGIGPHERVGQAHRVIDDLSNARVDDFLAPLA